MFDFISQLPMADRLAIGIPFAVMCALMLAARDELLLRDPLDPRTKPSKN